MPHPRKPPPAPAPHFEWRVPDGDTTKRHICGRCEYIHYVNPKIVVGSVVTHGDRIMLCRRAIDPRKTFWTLPAGFLEEHETPEDGARREAREEANAEIAIDALLAVYAVPHISQVQLMYRATLAQPTFSPGRKASTSRCSSGTTFRGRSLRSRASNGRWTNSASCKGRKFLRPFPTQVKGLFRRAFLRRDA